MRAVIISSPGGEHNGKFADVKGGEVWVDMGFCKQALQVVDLNGWTWKAWVPPEPTPIKRVFTASGPPMRWEKCDENEPFSEEDTP